jgi:hypothetical protein
MTEVLSPREDPEHVELVRCVRADVAENEAILEAQHLALLDEMRQQARYGAV